LLGKRNNAPARNYWFTPGGRIRKNEALDAAKTRIAHEELGLPLVVWERATLMGVWDHFYEESSFDPNVSTHYVNLPYWLEISGEERRQLQLPQGPHAQHAHWHWFHLADVESDTSIHPYARNNAKWVVEHCVGK
jgi:colanic acid biosynthesis protein WcaH